MALSFLKNMHSKCQKIGYIIVFFALLSTINVIGIAFAEQTETYRLYTSTHKDLIKFKNGAEGSQNGASLASGDFNNDGVDDLVMGAPLSSTNNKKWNGSVSITYGSHSKTHLRGSKADVTITGAYSEDQLGTALTVGDFNNDGIDDLAISAYMAYAHSQRLGKAYVFYGGVDMGSQEVNLLYSQPDVSLSGNAAGEGFGMVLSTVDMNGDNVDDLVVGSPFGMNSQGGEVGTVKSFLGGSQGLSTDVHLALQGSEVKERFGSSIAAGDLDGDGFKELAIGAYLADNNDIENSGALYIYKNIENKSGKDIKPDHVMRGSYVNDWYSFGLQIDDLDLDGIADLIVSSFSYKGDRSNGKLWAHYGGQNFFDGGRVEIIAENILSRHFLLDDLNSDGGKDLIIGDPGLTSGGQNEEGSVYIKYWQKDNVIPNSIIHGEYANDWFGYSLSTLDFNGDGRKELAISARYADGEDSVNNGAVYVFWAINNPYGELIHSNTNENQIVKRGELSSLIINSFNLREKRSEEISRCLDHLEFCLFSFVAMSDFDEIDIDGDLKLYPDVDTNHPHYTDINLATMLGILNGFLNEDNSPFGPEREVSRVQALKVILGASGLVKPMYRFELVESLGSLEKVITQPTYFPDVLPAVPRMWWYPSYVNFAWENGIIDKNDLFRPEENITMSELNLWIQRTIEYLNIHNAQADSRGDTGNQTIN